MVNRLNSDASLRLHQLLVTLTESVATFQQRLRGAFDEQLTAAVAEARGKLPAHRAISDEDLRREARIKIWPEWLNSVKREHKEMEQQAGIAREILDFNKRTARELSLPSAPSTDTQQRIVFGLDLMNLRLEFPRETPLQQLWKAFVAADDGGDTLRAGFLENMLDQELRPESVGGVSGTVAAAVAGASDPRGAAAAGLTWKKTRAQLWADLEARRDRRLTEIDRSNLDAWERDLSVLESMLSAANRQLIAHNRHVA